MMAQSKWHKYEGDENAKTYIQAMIRLCLKEINRNILSYLI
jgi:hypothetical protein